MPEIGEGDIHMAPKDTVSADDLNTSRTYSALSTKAYCWEDSCCCKGAT